jgi:hypothetical protein
VGPERFNGGLIHQDKKRTVERFIPRQAGKIKSRSAVTAEVGCVCNIGQTLLGMWGFSLVPLDRAQAFLNGQRQRKPRRGKFRRQCLVFRILYVDGETLALFRILAELLSPLPHGWFPPSPIYRAINH